MDRIFQICQTIGHVVRYDAGYLAKVEYGICYPAGYGYIAKHMIGYRISGKVEYGICYPAEYRKYVKRSNILSIPSSEGSVCVKRSRNFINLYFCVSFSRPGNSRHFLPTHSGTG